MAIKVADLEARIREQAGELAICQIREAGLRDDIEQLQAQLAAISAVEEEAEESKPVRTRRGR